MKKVILLILSVTLIVSCSSDDGEVIPINSGNDNNPDNPNNPDNNPDPMIPTAAILLFPSNNLECNEGTVVNKSESSVVFKWESSQNTTDYEIVIKNLLTQEITTENSTVNEKEITIKRATPYSWYVISKSNATNHVAQSEIWKFYNSGVGITSHAPFPANLISPKVNERIENNSVILDFTASDVDNDLEKYHLYIGFTPEDLVLSRTEICKESNQLEIGINPNKTYYWKVVTIDSQGNTSESSLSKFYSL